MTQRTRYFLVGSALVVVVGLCTGLVANYNGGLSFSAASQDSELSYLPADVTALAYADVRTIMSSAFSQKLREVMPTGEGKNELQRDLGVDLERDIDVVVAGFTGDDPSKGGALVLVRGRFNDGLIETTAVQHGAKAEDYHGKRMLLMTEGHTAVEGHPAPEGVRQPAVGFLEPGLLALGDVDSVRQAIDRPGKNSDVTTNVELMKLVNDVRGGANAWAVGRFDLFSKHASLPDEIKAKLPALQHVAVSAHVNGGVNGTLRAETRDEQAARDLKAVLNGALAAGRLVAGQDQRANAVLNSLQVGGTEKSVTLSFAVSPDVLDVLSGIAAHHGPRPGVEMERRPSGK